MIHSVARKHLWPRCLRSSQGISWGWVRKERLLLLLSDPPLTSFQHSSCKSFLSYFSFFTTPQRFSFVSNLHLNAHFLFSARTKKGQLFPNSPIPSFPYSPRTLSHTITKYQALPSPISRMLGELRRSAGRGIQSDTQSVVVGAAVCQSHLHSMVFQPASFKWSSGRKAAVRVWCAPSRRRGSVMHVCVCVCVCVCARVLVGNTEKAQRHESCALTQVRNEWMHGGNEQRQLASRSIPVV